MLSSARRPHGLRTAAASTASLGVLLLRRHLRVELFRNAYTLTLSVAAAAGLGMVYWLLAARLYSVEAVGTSAAAIAALTFVAGVSALQLDSALIRFLPRSGGRSATLMARALLLGGGVSAVVATLFLSGLHIWSPQLSLLRAAPWMTVGFVIGAVASTMSVIQEGAFIGLRAVIWTPLKTLCFGAAKVVLLVLLAEPAPEYGILISWIVPLIAVVFVTHWLMFVRLIPRHRAEEKTPPEAADRRQLARYVGGNYLASLFQLGTTQLLPLIVLHMAGSAASAYFALPWMIAAALRLVSINMSASLVLEGVSDRARLSLFARQALAQTSRLLLPAVLVLCGTAPFLLRLYGREYSAEGSLTLQLLALAALPNSVCVLFIGLARVQDRVFHIAGLQAVTAASSIGLTLVLLPRYGPVGVSVAWLMTQTVLAAALIWMQLWPLLKNRGGLLAQPPAQA